MEEENRSGMGFEPSIREMDWIDVVELEVVAISHHLEVFYA